MKKTLLVLGIIMFLFSCEKTETPEKQGTDEPLSSEVDNNLIELNKVLGGNDNYSVIYDLLPLDDNNFIFRGIINYEYLIGQISTNGDIVWSKSPDFEPNYINYSFSGYILVSGNKDTDNDGANDIGYIAMYDKSNGNLITQTTFDNHENIHIYSVSPSILETNGDTGGGGTELEKKRGENENLNFVVGKITELKFQNFHFPKNLYLCQ